MVSATRHLFGRSSELAELRSTLEAAAGGAQRIGVVEGEAGIGKTALVDAAVDLAPSIGLQVFRGVARPLEGDRPFGPLIDALGVRGAQDPIQRKIARLLEGGGIERVADAVADTRFRIVEEIAELVEQLAVRKPLLLALEDLQWADPSTALGLGRLAVTSEGLGVAVVVTLRPTPRSPEISAFLDSLASRNTLRVDLKPLPPDAVVELAEAVLRAKAGRNLRNRLAGAGGNPLFISELVAAFDQEGLIERADGVADVDDVSLPPSLTLTILRRIAFLSEPTLEMLRLAAVLGDPLSVADLATVADKPITEVLPSIGEAEAAKLLGEREGRLVFRHDLVREAIYEDMLEPVRKAMHAHAARALASAGAPVERVARHAALGAEAGDTQAVRWLTQAANEVLARAPGIAVDLLRRARELVGDRGDEDEIDVMLAWALVAASRPEEAEQVVADVATRLSRPDLRCSAVRARAAALVMRGRWSDASESLLATSANHDISPSDRAGLLADRAHALFFFNREAAGPEAEAAIDLARIADAASAEAVATAALGWCRFFDGFFDEGRELGERAIALTLRDGSAHGTRRDATYLRLVCLANSDRAAEAEDAFEALRVAHEDDDWATAARYHRAWAEGQMYAARWDAAIAEVETALAICDEAQLVLEAALARQLQCYIEIHRDELSAAQATIEKIPGAMWTRALLAEARGAQADLTNVLEDFRRSVHSPRPWNAPLLRLIAPDWVRLYLRAGDAESASTLTHALEEVAGRAQSAIFDATALRCRGLLGGDATLLVRSVERYTDTPLIFERALAQEEAGEALVLGGETEDAVALFRQALATYESAGAVRDSSRAESRLRGLGKRPGRRGARGRPRSGWDSLTETELRVAALVAEGLTYPEIGQRLFVSKRTVHTHVSHIFAKLGLSSRTELARAWWDRAD